LPNIIVENNLGEFNAIPTDQQLLAKAAQLNQRLDINQVHIEEHANNQARLVVNTNSTVYAQG
jgi:hypothetical protein